MNGARTKNNQEHNNNNNKKLKLKVVCAHFLGGGGEGGGGGVIPRLSATSQVGEEVRLSRRKQYRADTVGIHDMQQKKPSNDIPSTRIRLFLKQQLHELSADSLVSCERKALPSKNAFSKVS